MAQANSFTDVIHRDWDHIFAGSNYSNNGLSRYGTSDEGHGSPRQDLRVGDGAKLHSCSYSLSLFEKNSSHQDYSRPMEVQFTTAVRPFPNFITASGESVEMCFGHACTGARCSRSTFTKLYLSLQSTWDAPRSSWESIRRWLALPVVSARVSLTSEAQRIPGLGRLISYYLPRFGGRFAIGRL